MENELEVGFDLCTVHMVLGISARQQLQYLSVCVLRLMEAEEGGYWSGSVTPSWIVIKFQPRARICKHLWSPGINSEKSNAATQPI